MAGHSAGTSGFLTERAYALSSDALTCVALRLESLRCSLTPWNNLPGLSPSPSRSRSPSPSPQLPLPSRAIFALLEGAKGVPRKGVRR